MGRIERALICLNGHVINKRSETESHHNQKRCIKCGEETISQCPECNAMIKGYYIPKDAFFESPHSFQIGMFCDECGKPYPWTVEKIQATKDLIDELDELKQEERDKLKNSIYDLLADTPRSEVAVTVFKKNIPKINKALAKTLLDMVVSIATDTIKKSLLGL